MKPILRWTLIVLGVLVILASITIYLVIINLNDIVRRGVEIGGTYALGVETTLQEVDLRPLRGSIALKGLRVANPEGFSDDHFMLLQNISINADINTLTTNDILIYDLTIDGLDVNLEIRDDQNNYDVILANLKKLKGDQTAEDQSEPAPPAPEESPKRTLAANTITIQNLEADADVKLGGSQQRTVHVKVPPIELKDFRTDEGKGPVVSQLSGVITRVVLTAIAKQGHELLPAAALGTLEEGLGALGDVSVFTIKGVGTVGKGVLNLGKDAVEGAGKVGKDAVEGVGNMGKGAVKGVGDVGKGIGNLITGKKKEKPEQEQNDDTPNEE
ncbi:AsmA family protein [Mucisphaera calidilacus]|uniref:AsmA domain-containing protein n=1 Tax=Mucisphaera calidilacus TaxID=2527982 RepID=A0A518C0V0_9BACT|nr:hypothetical protein [Mucisphaera calidilacus]QDU72853.1 hypothetical protein Pan265_27290 [Mucisphaera calidilacus]